MIDMLDKYRPPKDSLFRLDTEEWDYSDAEEDQYFNSMVDNFVSASADVIQSALSEDEIEKVIRSVRQSDKYADIALKHYNNDAKNKVKVNQHVLFYVFLLHHLI